MQSLTAQWLQHEVRNLEEKTNRRMKLGGLYLVPDASVLIFHLPVLKQMLATPSHMVIIPQVGKLSSKWGRRRVGFDFIFFFL